MNKFPAIVFFILFFPRIIFSQVSGDSASLRNKILVSTDSTQKSRDTLALSIQDFQLRTDSLSAGFFTDPSFFYKIITHDELMKDYHEDFADFLWHTGGFYVHDLGSYGKTITASANGLSNKSFLLLYDGVPMNDPDAGWMNLNAISLENIERIEIFRGNASAVYGSAAAGGYINIVPRKVSKDRALTSVKFRSAFSTFQDVGVFFGRNFGNRLQIGVGGSKKSTPGEQTLQGLQGGILKDVQATRYNGTILFGRIDFLIDRHWSTNFYTQRSRDRFDAYGRNLFGDENVFSFATGQGFRKDERTDYHFGVTRNSENTLLQTHAYVMHIDRTSKNFTGSSIPEFYTARAAGFDIRYGFSVFSHALAAGVSYRHQSVDSLILPHPAESGEAVWVSDKFSVGPLAVQPSVRGENHSVYHRSGMADVKVLWPIAPTVTWLVNGGYTVAYPSLIDAFQRNANFSTAGAPAPHDFLFAADSLRALRPQKITSLSSTLRLKELFYLDEITLSGYANRLRDAIYYYPVHFNTDSMKIKADNLAHAKTYGVDIEAVKRISIFQFTARQSLVKGNDEVRGGIPAYRTYLAGAGEIFFFNNNLKVTGFLSAMYFRSHSGFTFEDAPQIYFITPRRARGGWALNTRISANIGDLQIFYEAENFLRARFTLLDGYDITRQQYRFGIIWKLYN